MASTVSRAAAGRIVDERDRTSLASIQSESFPVAASTPHRPWATHLLSVPVAIGTLLVVSVGIHFVLGRAVRAPWVVPDELIYAELARSIASDGVPAIRDVPTLAYGVVYAAFIAPAWALFSDGTRSYEAAKLLGAIAMSSSAVPAFFLARRFVSAKGGLLVAGMTLALPGTAYAGLVFSENLFLPVFLLAILTVARALEHPTHGRQAAAVSVIGLVCLVRPQGIAVAVSYLGSIALVTLLAGRECWRTTLSRYKLSLAVSAVGGSAVAAVGPLGVVGSRSLFAAYGGVAAWPSPADLVRWGVITVGGLALSAVVVPFLASFVVVASGLKGHDRRARHFTVLAFPQIVGTLLMVTWFSAVVPVNGREALNERYFFYLVPILLIGMGLWIERGMRRPRRLAAGVAVGTAVLVAMLPVETLAENASFQAPSLIPWVLAGGGRVATTAALLCFVGALVALWLWTPVVRSGRLWVAVAGVSIAIGALASLAFVSSSQRSLEMGIGTSRGWVDRAVPAGATVAVLWNEPEGDTAPSRPRHRIVWLSEFFNHAVSRVYTFGGSIPYGLPEHRVRLAGSAVIEEDGQPMHERLVLARCDLRVVGRVVAVDRVKRVVLTEVTGSVRLGRTPPC